MAQLQVAGAKLSWTTLLALSQFTYLLLGATVFQLLEKEAENQNRVHFQLEKLYFLANYSCLDGAALEKFVQVIIISLIRCRSKCLHVLISWKLRSLDYYIVLLQVILDARESGVNPAGNSTNPSNWDFGSSFFFAGTVVTTIGKWNVNIYFITFC